MLRKNKKLLITLLLFVSIALCIHFIKEKYRTSKLKNTQETWAIYISNSNTVGISGARFFFLNEKGKRINVLMNKSVKYDVGDTVWIKYSLYDNTVAEVIDPYYMQKYKLIQINNSD